MSSAPDKQHDTRLRALAELLDGTSRAAEKREAWKDISERASKVLKGKCEVETARVSPDGRHLAVNLKVRQLLGLRTNNAGLIYSLPEGAIVGRVAVGTRGHSGWQSA